MKKQKGFTLVEMVVVILIMAILAALAVGAIIAARNAAKEATNRSNAKSIQVGMEAAYSRTRTYPAFGTATDLKTAGANAAVGVTITPGSGDCSNGGGTIQTSTVAGSPTYTITVYKADCSSPSGTTYTGPNN